MAGIRRIDTSDAGTVRVLGWPVRLEDCVPPSPTEANDTNLVGTGDHLNGVDEAIDKRLADAFTVLEQPWRKRRGDRRGVLGRVDHPGTLFVLETGLYTLEEFDWKRIALVNVGNVGVEASFGVSVC